MMPRASSVTEQGACRVGPRTTIQSSCAFTRSARRARLPRSWATRPDCPSDGQRRARRARLGRMEYRRRGRPQENAMKSPAKGLDLVIAGGRVVTSTEVVDAAVGVRDGRIAAIAPVELLPPAERTIDATGKI